MARCSRIGVVVIACALAGACSSSSRSNSTPTTPILTSTTTPSTTANGPASSAPASSVPASSVPARPTAVPTGPAAAEPCTTAQLVVTLDPSEGAAGHAFAAIVFTNSSRSTCTLVGYPGVSFIASNGKQLGAAADRRVTAPPPIEPATPPVNTLALGGRAYATLVVTSTGNQAGCRPPKQTARAAKLRIYPPNTAVPVLSIPWTQEVCSSPRVHQLSVTAVGEPLS